MAEETKDFFQKIQTCIKNFCNAKPYTGFHIEYLEKASEILHYFQRQMRL